MKKIILTILVIFSVLSCNSQTEPSLSGVLKGGLRTISISSNTKLDFTIYRGDYIVLELDGFGPVEFSVPELGIYRVIPAPENESNYTKMKKAGVYNFTLGDSNGVINVLEYSGANYKEVTAKEASDIIKNIEPYILDVRTEGEYKAGHIENADLLPVQILSDNLDSISKYKNEPILLYCASGNRSTVAAKILVDNGFTNVYNLRYGFGDWKINGMPTVR